MHRVAYENANPEVIGEVSAADPDLGRLLTACLAKEPAERPTPQELIDAAAARTTPAAWPEPLSANLLARQQAYETLRRLPVATLTRLWSPAAPAVFLRAGNQPCSVPRGATDALPTRPGDSIIGAAGPDRDFVPARQEGVMDRRRLPLSLPPGCGDLLEHSRGAARDRRGSGSRRPLRQQQLDRPRGPFVLPVPSGTSALTRPDVDGAVDEDLDGGAKTATSHTGAQHSAGADPDADADPGDGVPSPTVSPTDSPSPTASTGTTPWLSECTYYTGSGLTRLGDSGKRVQQVQCMLTKRGYGVGSTGVDGEFGTGTQDAVQAFQSDRGLDTDGVVAHDTWVALRGTE